MTSTSVTPPPLTVATSIDGLSASFRWAADRALAYVQDASADGVMPSYWAALTDRPMFYSRDLAHQMLGAHLLGLDEENLAMLRHFAASATEERGWYPLWAFLFDGTPAEIDYRGDDDFVREIPAPFELVEKAVEQHLWTRDPRFLEDPHVEAFVRSTMTDFVVTHDPLGTGVAGEPGTGDIWAGTATYNEVEKPPYLIVAADGIASQWKAHASLGALGADHVDADLGAWHRARATALAEIFHTEWWLDDDGHYAAGFTSEGPARGFGLESTWFPAVKGLMTHDERAGRHLDFLTRSLAERPPHNIEATTYLPEAYLAYGRDAEALAWIRSLGESRDDYPEVSFTHVAHVVAGLCGVAPQPDGTLETRPRIPDGDWITVTGIRVGDSVVDLRHDGRGSSELRVVAGPAVTWRPTWDDGHIPSILVPPGSRATARRGDDAAVLSDHHHQLSPRHQGEHLSC